MVVSETQHAGMKYADVRLDGDGYVAQFHNDHLADIAPTDAEIEPAQKIETGGDHNYLDKRETKPAPEHSKKAK